MAFTGVATDYKVTPSPMRPDCTTEISTPTTSDAPSTIRRWLGDLQYAVIVVRDEPYWPDVREAFPEAAFVEMGMDGVRIEGRGNTYIVHGTRR